MVVLVSHRRARPRRASRRAGFSLVEVCVVLVILFLATNIFCQTVISTMNMRRVTYENRTAARAVQTVLESMRGEDFEDIFALYNADPEDDPDGNWTAPGHLFEVRGLELLADSPIPAVGEIMFPSLEEAPDKPKSLKDLEKESEKKEKVREDGVHRGGIAFPGPVESNRWFLREDFVNESLGMPRDLNGDYKIDAVDHAEDYVRLPLCVRVRWQGRSGPRTFQIHTILADYTHRDEKLVKAQEKAKKEAEKAKEKEEKEAEKRKKEEEKKAKDMK